MISGSWRDFLESIKLSKLPSKLPGADNRVVRILKVVKTKGILKKSDKPRQTGNYELEKLVIFFFIFAILCHNLACLWFLVAKFQDLGETTWVYIHEYDTASTLEQYLASLYFIVTTITTVGYGDITSKNPAE